MEIIGGAIPGQSLTKKPGNYPWDKPSKLNDVDEIIKLHLDTLSEKKSIDNLLLVLERGLPLNILVETYLTTQVMKGIHNIDVSILVAPVVHEFLYDLAKDAGLDFKEFSDEKVSGTKEKALMLLKAELKSTPEEEQDSGFEILEDMTTALKEQPEEGSPKPEEGLPKPEEEEAKPPKGLMSRGNSNGS